MSRIKNVIFDIGNVLVDWDWKGYTKRLFPDEKVREVLDKCYWTNELWREMDRGALSQETIHRELIKLASPYEKEMETAYSRLGECITSFDYTKPYLSELKTRGYKVYYLSNYSDYLINKNPEVLDFIKEMDGGIFSCYVKLIKPDLQIYDALCKKYDLVPEECLFTDDKYINVVAAIEYGMKAVQFKGFEETKDLIEQELGRKD